jgi:hypothetical protein
VPWVDQDRVSHTYRKLQSCQYLANTAKKRCTSHQPLNGGISEILVNLGEKLHHPLCRVVEAFIRAAPFKHRPERDETVLPCHIAVDKALADFQLFVTGQIENLIQEVIDRAPDAVYDDLACATHGVLVADSTSQQAGLTPATGSKDHQAPGSRAVWDRGSFDFSVPFLVFTDIQVLSLLRRWFLRLRLPESVLPE